MTVSPGQALFVGAATWDVVAELPHLPAPDTRVIATDMTGAGGGPAATAAVTFARLGLPARLVATVGADREGAAITETLVAEGVDASSVRARHGVGSGRCVVLVDTATATRSICVCPGPPPSPDPADLRSAHWLHVDHLGLPTVEELFDGLPAGTARPTVSYDAGNLHPRRCPPWVDLYAPTLDTLRKVYGGGDVAGLLAAALADGATWAVATDGAGGAFAADRTGHYRVPAHDDVAIRSTLGAGDVFHGALLAAYALRMDLADGLAYANAAAALSCRGLDGRSAIAGHDETSALATRRPAVPTSART